MKSIILSGDQIQQVVTENKYKIDPQKKLFSRCSDDRYQDDLALSPLSIPGADAGELALLFATAHAFGFEVVEEKAYWVLSEIVGGVKNLHFHTDSKNKENILAGCGHYVQMLNESTLYHISKEQLEFIRVKAENSIAMGAENSVLAGKHHSGAIIQINGNFDIYPSCVLESEEGKYRVEFFTIHQTLVNERHKNFAKLLMKEKAVKLYEGCDEEYLYEVMTQMTDEHFFETVTRNAKGLPIFDVVFENDGSFEIEEMDKA